MIQKLGQVMLYVADQDIAAAFWTEKLGFTVIADETSDSGMRWIEIAPSINTETRIVLHDKAVVAELSPELNLGTPSLMFFTENLEELHQDLLKKQVTVGEIDTIPTGKVFNFSDDEDNYFAVMESF